MEQAPHWLTHCHNITRQITLPLVPRHRALCSPPPPPMPYCTISVGHNPHDLYSWHTNATSTKHSKRPSPHNNLAYSAPSSLPPYSHSGMPSQQGHLEKNPPPPMMKY